LQGRVEAAVRCRVAVGPGGGTMEAYGVLSIESV